jgi:hypothetical protein
MLIITILCYLVMYGMFGAIFGPWGAAIGVAIGIIMLFRK